MLCESSAVCCALSAATAFGPSGIVRIAFWVFGRWNSAFEHRFSNGKRADLEIQRPASARLTTLRCVTPVAAMRPIIVRYRFVDLPPTVWRSPLRRQ